ncbi:hypothetical protein, variant 3 [Fonticula alba]|nr:hypothetical protein, variant 1 [Fonticula alba]XP_009493839.1 hypothetical protein, variant 2 [Fonticula alba]XP_009493840.1 hypothetical protein, variant 3 [Fonticula alba]KCV72261.1 hypothetical protein, variant 1 [Fonticula alba]KCV72262.1 hypothetical protein, variant 2 [Fonticula alba]KCV72263.1 hypothetical protein, variant 3 [Fonticula alba]|eukprot:XP_009493838.1 hypothetical protein, variant 1 [Fonticula alba]
MTSASAGGMSTGSGGASLDLSDPAGAYQAANTKRPRLLEGTSHPPSAVLHVRNLPQDVTEIEINEIIPYPDRVVKIMVMKNKCQALIQFSDVSSATRVISYFQTNKPYVRGRLCYFQYSSRNDLNEQRSATSTSAGGAGGHSSAGSGGMSMQGGFAGQVGAYGAAGAAGGYYGQAAGGPGAAGGAYAGYSGAGAGAGYPGAAGMHGQAAGAGGYPGAGVGGPGGGMDASGAGVVTPAVGGTPGAPGRVLHITITNCKYPIFLDTIIRVFSYHGELRRAILVDRRRQNPTGPISNPDDHKALVEYFDPAAASIAMESLQNQCLYVNSGVIQVQLSHLPELTVRQITERTWCSMLANYSAAAAAAASGHMLTPGAGAAGHGGDHHAGAMGGHHAAVAAAMGHHHGGMSGHMMAGGGQGSGAGMYGAGPGGMMGAGGPGAGAFGPVSPVLVVNRLNEERVTCDHLFNIFSIYGEVETVKIMFSRRRTALVKFASPDQSTLALQMLNGVSLFGSPMGIMYSKHMSINRPSENNPNQDPTEAMLTKVYTGPQYQRYQPNKVSGRMHPSHAIKPAPSASLHISNLPIDVTERQLSDQFSRFGMVVEMNLFKRKPETRTNMGIVRLESLDAAVSALACLHRTSLPTAAVSADDDPDAGLGAGSPEQLLMRISFAKSSGGGGGGGGSSGSGHHHHHHHHHHS